MPTRTAQVTVNEAARGRTGNILLPGNYGDVSSDGTILMLRNTIGARANLNVDRKVEYNILDYGGTPDCTDFGVGTLNDEQLLNTINAAGPGGKVRIPRGKYRFGQRPIITFPVQILCDGWGMNSGWIYPVQYTGIGIYYGTVLVFDEDVGGPLFIGAANLAHANDLVIPNGLIYPGAGHSGFKDACLIGSWGVGTQAHGLELRVPVVAENLYITGFAGNGLHIDSSTGGSTNPYGSTDSMVLKKIHTRANACHGQYVRGNDANVIQFINHDSAVNGGAGYLENGFLGNKYGACHAASNNQSHPDNIPGVSPYSAAQRAYVTDMTGGAGTQTGSDALADRYAGSYITTSQVGAHVFIDCYSEAGEGGKHQIIAPSLIIGGNLASQDWVVPAAGSGARPATWNSSALIGIDYITASSGVTKMFNNFTIDPPVGSGNATVKLYGQGTFTNVQLFPTGSAALGMDILTGPNGGYLSANQFVLRDAAQTTQIAYLATGRADLYGNLTIAPPTGYGNGLIDLSPSPGATYSILKMRGMSGNIALGLDITTGQGATSFSSDTFYFRNAAQTKNYLISGPNYLKLEDAGSGYPDISNDGLLWYSSTYGMVVGGSGSSYDVMLNNALGTTALVVPHNSQNVQVIGSVSATNLSGTNTGDQTITLTGDVTGSGGGSFAATIGSNKVTYAKFQQVAASKLVGNPTGALANASEIGLASGLIFSGINLSLGAITPTSVAATGTVTGSNLSGTNTGDQTITLTGDVTGSGVGSFAATIGANKVTFSKFIAATQAALVGATAAGNFQEITLAGGLAFNLGTLTLTGAIAPSSIAATGTVTGSNLSGTNTGDQTITLTGDVTGSGAGSFAATIGANKVTFAKFVAATAAGVVGASAAGNFAQLGLANGITISGGNLGLGAITPTSSTASGNILTSGGVIGYTAGAGGAVTQLTSRTTAVTINKGTGAITLFSTTTTAGAVTTFQVNNSLIAATDTINLSVQTATGIYLCFVTNVGAGFCKISVYTPAAVGSAEAPVINFAVIKAVNA